MRDSPHAFDRVISSINASQLQSKLWIVNELNNLNIHQKSAALLGGWYAHFTVPLLLEQGVEFVHNFEIDEEGLAVLAGVDTKMLKELATSLIKNIRTMTDTSVTL